MDKLRRLLERYIESKVQLRRDSKRAALDSWEPKVGEIIHKVTTYDKRFNFRVFPTGSYYDGLKVKEPDEFDLMLIMGQLNPELLHFEGGNGLQNPPTGKSLFMLH